jgi:hypothetical protein
MLRRFRTERRTPLAVGALLAGPVFFVSLMAFSLDFEKPRVLASGKLADPSSSTEWKIWLVALVPSLAIVLVGALAIPLGRLGTIASASAAILAAGVLLVPLKTWAREHTARFPDGIDLIPKSAGSQDIFLRGEWEGLARHAADQLGVAAIVLGAIAIVFTLFFDLRRRRGIRPVPVPPPPETAGGAPSTATSSLFGGIRLPPERHR